VKRPRAAALSRLNVLALACVLAVLTALLAVLLGVLVWRIYRPPLPPGATVICVTPRPDEQSIHGVVVRASRRQGVTLAAASLLEPDLTATPIGDVWLPRISFAQRNVAPVAHTAEQPKLAKPVPLGSNAHGRHAARRAAEAERAAQGA
jgi:hypothetical protein